MKHQGRGAEAVLKAATHLRAELSTVQEAEKRLNSLNVRFKVLLKD